VGILALILLKELKKERKRWKLISAKFLTKKENKPANN
jgi:hypothetical protein